MWIIDNGATLHVTTKKDFFTSYTPSEFGVLKIGNDGVSKVIGVGLFCFGDSAGTCTRNSRIRLIFHFNFILL